MWAELFGDLARGAAADAAGSAVVRDARAGHFHVVTLTGRRREFDLVLGAWGQATLGRIYPFLGMRRAQSLTLTGVDLRAAALVTFKVPRYQSALVLQTTTGPLPIYGGKAPMAMLVDALERRGLTITQDL